jgi:Ribbon-helix-helix protein, copG family
MDLSPYIESVRTGVANASSLADEQTQHVAERLGTAIESSTRLALIQALSDAAGTISADLAPSSVELGMDPEFVVTVQTGEAEPTLLMPETGIASTEASEPSSTETDEEPVARITLRLPQSVKARVDEMASSEGISTNAWLIRAVMDALSERSGSRAEWPQPPHPPQPPIPPSPNVIFGVGGPFSEQGVFGPEGPFGPGGVFGERLRRARREEKRSRGNVQGWVR